MKLFLSLGDACLLSCGVTPHESQLLKIRVVFMMSGLDITSCGCGLRGEQRTGSVLSG